MPATRVMSSLLRGQPTVSRPARPLCGCGHGTVSPGAAGAGRLLLAQPPPSPGKTHTWPSWVASVTDRSRPPDAGMCLSALVFTGLISAIQSPLPTATRLS